MSVADAAITVWDSKRHYNFWRPITAIHEAENDGNPATAGDPVVAALLDHAALYRLHLGCQWRHGRDHSLAHQLLRQGRRDLHDHEHLRRQSRRRAPTTSFSDYANDMVNVRIYQGIHFRFADVAGREQGEKVADYVFKNVATPK